MIRALSIIAAFAALAVSAAPASAGPWNGGGTDHAWGTHHFKASKPKPRSLDIGTAERLDMNARLTAKGRGAVNAMFFPWDMA